MQLSKHEFLSKVKHDKVAFNGELFSYALLPKFLDTTDTLRIICPLHGEFSQRASCHLQYKGCNGCANENRVKVNNARRRTPEEWLAARKHNGLSVSGRPYQYLNLGPTVPKRIRYSCPDHGIRETYAFAHLSHGCNKCAASRNGKNKRGLPNHRLLSLEEAKKRVNEKYPELDLSKVKSYSGSKDVWTVTCSQHRLKYEVKVFNLLWGGSNGCKECLRITKQDAGARLSKLKSESLIKAAEKHGYSIVERGLVHDPITLSCKKHGVFTLAKAYYLTQCTSICPECRKGSSKPELRLVKALRHFGLKVQLHRRDIIKGLEVDLVLPEYNLCIEVNGIYHHKDKDRDYHLNKTLRAQEKGFTLLHFTDVEILRHLKLVTSMILSRCGICEFVLNARQLKVAELEPTSARDFYIESHLQGFVGALSHLGLIDEDGNTVAAMSFGSPRFSDKGDWEILRFAVKPFTSIRGGFSRLLKAFRNSHTGSILSYADRRYSTGKVYLQSGFALLAESKPSFVWFSRTGEQVSRFMAQKRNQEQLLDDFDPELSGSANMVMNGYIRLWDCGTLLFKLN